MINISVKGFKLSDGTVEKYDYSSLEDIVTDTTLALSGVAADAKKVGDEISEIKEDLLNHEYRIDLLERGGGGSGLSEPIKQTLMTLFQNAVYTSDQSGTIETLYNLFFGGDVPVGGIYLNESSVTINAPITLVATLIPNGATGTVQWSSSNTGVATVSQTGLVTPVANGSATITASCEGYTATCAVTVDTSSVVDIEKSGSLLIIRATPNVTKSGSTLVFS